MLKILPELICTTEQEKVRVSLQIEQSDLLTLNLLLPPLNLGNTETEALFEYVAKSVLPASAQLFMYYL